MTLNSHNQALENPIAEMLAEWADSGHCKTPEQVARRILTLLDAARAEGPVQEHRKLNLPSQEWLDHHVETDPDIDTEAGGVTPPAGEVGRAVAHVVTQISAVRPLALVSAEHLRLILSHASNLAERHALLASDYNFLQAQKEAAEDSFKLAVEALEKIEAGLFRETSNRDSVLVEMSRETVGDIAREALSSLRPSASAPGSDVEAFRQSEGEG